VNDNPIMPINNKAWAQMKIDLAEALRARGHLQSRLKLAEEGLQGIQARVKADSKTIKELSAERAILLVKVKDRDEELRGKAQLLVVFIYLKSPNRRSRIAYVFHSKSKMRTCLSIYSLIWQNSNRIS